MDQHELQSLSSEELRQKKTEILDLTELSISSRDFRTVSRLLKELRRIDEALLAVLDRRVKEKETEVKRQREELEQIQLGFLKSFDATASTH